MGAIPKKHSHPSKWRIINDLSWPAGQSVNDPFSKELYTCSYVSIDQPISYLKSFGPNALISKFDHAFPLILVDPRDWENLGSIWPLVMSDGSTRTGYFFDILLPFALRSSPALFLKFNNGLRSMEPLWNYPRVLGMWPSRPKCRLLFESNVMLRTSADLGFATNKQFLLQRTLCFVASNLTLSPRNFSLILLVSPKSSISLTPGPLNNIVLNANYSFPYWQA